MHFFLFFISLSLSLSLSYTYFITYIEPCSHLEHFLLIYLV